MRINMRIYGNIVRRFRKQFTIYFSYDEMHNISRVRRFHRTNYFTRIANRYIYINNYTDITNIERIRFRPMFV